MDSLTTTSTLSLFDTNKDDRKRFVSDIIWRIMDGQDDPIKVLANIRCMEDICKQITASKEFRELCINEAEKHGKSHERYNAKFEVRETGTRYNFFQCGDATLLDLYEQQDKLAAQIKKREEFLRMVPSEGIEVIDSETGEVRQVFPPSKTSTTSVVVTLK